MAFPQLLTRTVARSLFGLAAVLAPSLVTGCSDDPLPGAVMAGAGQAAFSRSLAEDLDRAFAVDDEAELSSQSLIGAEWFEVRFTMRARAGRYVKAYGIRTPYEAFVKPVSPRLPLAIEGGAMVLRQVHFNRVPVAGEYPLEIWLINDEGDESNHVFSRVTVQ